MSRVYIPPLSQHFLVYTSIKNSTFGQLNYFTKITQQIRHFVCDGIFRYKYDKIHSPLQRKFHYYKFKQRNINNNEMILLQYYSKIFQSRYFIQIKIIDIMKFITIVEYYSFLKYFPNRFAPHMSAVRTAPGRTYTHQSPHSCQQSRKP